MEIEKKTYRIYSEGITLISLVITVIVMLIIAGVATTAGVESIQSARRTSVITELEMIQAKVDTIYEKRKINEEDISYYNSLGQDISVVEQSKLDIVLEGIEQEGYRYFSKEDLNKLDLDNMQLDVIINFDTRDIASINAININNKSCYRLQDIPGYQTNKIEYINKNTEAPTFDVEVTKLSNSLQINIKNIIYNSNVATGTISYKLKNSSNWIIEGKTNYFEVKQDGIYDIKLTDSAGNSTIVQTATNCKLVEDADGNIIPVPNGFTPITTDDQGTKQTGFVIKNDKDGNEFVWVPVDDTTLYKYERVAFAKDGWTYTQTKGDYDETSKSYKIIRADQAEYNYIEAIPTIEQNRTEAKSVSIYGGFYIGRYETGIEGYTNIDTSTSNTATEYTGYTGGNAIIQKDKQVWNYITMNKAKIQAENLYNKAKGDSITSRLCSSYAWDTTLKYIETKHLEYPTNSNVGNYSDKSSTLGTPAKTGQTTSVNNIYDMGGNVWEWTMEVCENENSYCTRRGGGYNNSSSADPAAVRGYSSNATIGDIFGFRVTLFL